MNKLGRTKSAHLTSYLSKKAPQAPQGQVHTTHNQYKNILAATIYTVLVLTVPWEELQGFPFVDRSEYLEYFLFEKNIFEYTQFGGILDYLKHEALWHYGINWLIHDAGISIYHLFLVITFLCIFSFSLFLIKSHGYLSTILLTNPLIITLAFSQLRLAFAFSVLLLAYMSKRKTLMLISILSCAFIHTATLLFVGIGASIYIINNIVLRDSPNKVLIFSAFLIAGLCISVALGPAMDVILSYFGDRRAEVYTGDAASGIKYTIYWSGLLLLCALQRTPFYKDSVNSYTIIILSTATFNLLTGGYTSRLLAVSLPMIFTTVLNFTPQYKYISITLYIIYISLQWVYWLPIRIFS